MTLRDSTGLFRSENSRVHRSAHRVARKPGISPTHIVGKFWRLTNFLATIVNWRKQDRYFDTGESGETHDAEMEAIAVTRDQSRLFTETHDLVPYAVASIPFLSESEFQFTLLRPVLGLFFSKYQAVLVRPVPYPRVVYSEREKSLIIMQPDSLVFWNPCLGQASQRVKRKGEQSAL